MTAKFNNFKGQPGENLKLVVVRDAAAPGPRDN